MAKRQRKPIPPRKKLCEYSPTVHLKGLEEFYGENIPPSAREPWRKLPMALRPHAEALLHERLKRYPPNKHRYLKGLLMANIVSHLSKNRDWERWFKMIKVRSLRPWWELRRMGFFRTGKKKRDGGK